jgi:hypothetical protein
MVVVRKGLAVSGLVGDDGMMAVDGDWEMGSSGKVSTQ